MSEQPVVVWGEVLWDLFPDGDQLGGAPANVAWHLGLAGGWSRLVSRVGNDARGRGAIARLEEVCDTSLVQIDPERETGVVEVELDHGEPRYRLVPERAWEHIACTPHVAEALREASVMMFGTLAQRRPDGLRAWRDAVAAARGTCLKVCDVNLRRNAASDLNERDAVAAALDVADVLKVNDRELEVLADWFGWSPGGAVDALRRGERILVVTHGEHGSTLHARSEAIEIAGVPSTSGGDHVGCGDAYVAILVFGMTQGWDLARSGRAASRWAAAVAGLRGATPRFSEEQIEDLLECEAA
jgi:fructokinase